MADRPPDPPPRGADDALRERLRHCIDGSGLTQRAFAERIGLDAPKLSKVLSGTRRITAEELVEVARVSGVTVAWLQGGDVLDDAGVAVAPHHSVMPRQQHGTPEARRSRRAVVAIARELVAERGIDNVSLAEVAASAGMSTSTVLYYVGSKRALLDECLRSEVKDAFDRQTAMLEDIDDPVEQLHALLDLQLPDPDGQARYEWSIWLQSWNAVAIGVGSLSNHAEAYARWFGTVRNILARGQATGVFVDIDTDDLARELTSMFDGMGVKVLTGIIGAEQMRAAVHAYVARCIRTQPSDSDPVPDLVPES